MVVQGFAFRSVFAAYLLWEFHCVQNPVEGVTGVLWMIFQPLLFGLIGAQVNIASLEPETVGKEIIIFFRKKKLAF